MSDESTEAITNVHALQVKPTERDSVLCRSHEVGHCSGRRERQRLSAAEGHQYEAIAYQHPTQPQSTETGGL